jgi:glycogen phosphorylase
MNVTERIRDRLPHALRALLPLSYNLRWSWHRPTAALFETIDAAAWAASGRNPVRLLLDVPQARLDALAGERYFVAEVESLAEGLRRYLRGEAEGRAAEAQRAGLRVAYFSAEFAITECLPIFAGGLGVLAGDHLKSASDLGVPLVAVGLLYKEGYFHQRLGPDGRQEAHYDPIDPELLPIVRERNTKGDPFAVQLPFLDRQVQARVWRADVGRVPLYLLDTDLEANQPEDRRITDRLYGGDIEHRLRQEIVLGIGGMRALTRMDRVPTVVHLNEGHAALAAVERARVDIEVNHGSFQESIERLASGVVFTTHTPVAAGHDRFSPELLDRYLGGYIWEMREPWEHFTNLGQGDPRHDQLFCMTTLAIRVSARRNGVSRLHGAVSREMWRSLWPQAESDSVPIGHVTNGIHVPTWISEPIETLLGTQLGEQWRGAGAEFDRVGEIPAESLWRARCEQRAALINRARWALAVQAVRRGEDPSWTSGALDPDALTFVFARRFATYKRAGMLLSDEQRLLDLLTGGRPVQFIFAGKAHPRDEPGQELLRRVASFALRPDVRGRFALIEDYDVELARYLVAGADVWLNVPRRPMEASGTSGMKAALNGALNVSILDGWWAEAWQEHNHLDAPIGWSVQAREAASAEEQDRADALALYRTLEEEVVPTFFERDEEGIPRRWLDRVSASLRQVVPYFNTDRMVSDYLASYYLPAHQEIGRWQRGGRAAL